MVTRAARTKALVGAVAIGAVPAATVSCEGGSGASGPADPRGSARPSGAVGAGTASASDALERWVERLEVIHPEPFHAVGRAEFVAALDQLAAELPDLSPAEAAVGVMRVAGLLSRERDGHQFALPRDDAIWPVLPLQVYELPEGVVVTAAQAPYEDLVGSTLVAVGDRPIGEVLAMIEPLVPRDGPATVAAFRPRFLLRTVVLRGLGIVPDVDGGSIELTVADAAGRRVVEVAPITLDEHVAWAGPFGLWRLPSLPGLDYLRPAKEPVSWTYLAAHRALYVRETEVRPAGAVVAEARDRVQQPDVDRFVLDLRQNPGGDNHNNPVMVDLVAHLAVTRPDVPIVVITDRVTFSAAANLATDLEQATDAIFVGEAMGGGLNFWDDVTFVELDGLPLPMEVGISTRYWQRAEPDDPRLTIEPDVPVPVTWADLERGRDRALEAALAVG